MQKRRELWRWWSWAVQHQIHAIVSKRIEHNLPFPNTQNADSLHKHNRMALPRINTPEYYFKWSERSNELHTHTHTRPQPKHTNTSQCARKKNYARSIVERETLGSNVSIAAVLRLVVRATSLHSLRNGVNRIEIWLGSFFFSSSFYLLRNTIVWDCVLRTFPNGPNCEAVHMV